MSIRNVSQSRTMRELLRITPSSGVVLACGALIVVTASCGSDSTGPVDPLSKVPDFIYVSNASGGAQLYTWHKGTSTLFPGSLAGDIEPRSAAGKVVFTSYRISPSNPEIYIANLDGSNTLRLTTDTHTDHQPSLSADGATVVFSSNRSGTSRLWTMGSDGSNPAALSTGSDATVPESAPRYSPDGSELLFNSPRTNTAQIWVMPAAGGTATQVTHEANGAFAGSWSPDGKFIFYIDGVDRTVIHRTTVATGATVSYVTGGSDVGDPACTNDLCLVVTNNTSVNRDIYAYIGEGDTAPLPILNDASISEYQPAILHP
jgi:WD40 repeat protein